MHRKNRKIPGIYEKNEMPLMKWSFDMHLFNLKMFRVRTAPQSSKSNQALTWKPERFIVRRQNCIKRWFSTGISYCIQGLSHSAMESISIF